MSTTVINRNAQFHGAAPARLAVAVFGAGR